MSAVFVGCGVGLTLLIMSIHVSAQNYENRRFPDSIADPKEIAQRAEERKVEAEAKRSERKAAREQGVAQLNKDGKTFRAPPAKATPKVKFGDFDTLHGFDNSSTK